MSTPSPRRIIVIDDNKAIHEDIRKIICAPARCSELDALAADLFGEPSEALTTVSFEVDSALQGQDGFEMIQAARASDRPFHVAFVDMRMPPGWDGLETIEQIRRVDPDIQVVICSAYSDRSWAEITAAIGHSDGLLVLKKPFDNIEIQQMAHALSEKWLLERERAARFDALDALVAERTHSLQAANTRLEEEMRARERVQMELRVAQKLEAVGQLASGIAHEINTPIQYIGDSVYFLRSAFEDLKGALDATARALPILESMPEHASLLEEVLDAHEAADVEYLDEQVPKAFARTLEGLSRVSEIVRAMKEFSHPDQRQKVAADINAGIRSTLTVARNEYKYVADLEMDLGEIPQVICHLGDLNQVCLNLIVNAAHAIADRVGESGDKGHIHVSTRDLGDSVEIAIADDGGGIPLQYRERVFDPFFTTKEVGKGTGQGLAIAHSIVVDKHGGSIGFEVDEGVGTTFRIRLPVAEESRMREAS